MNPNWVTGVGPSNAKLMVVGESLGKTEEERGIPFVGASGELLTEMLEIAGIKRSQVYITNVVKIRPPNNTLSRLGEITNPATGTPYCIDDFLPLLKKEIEIMQPNCILALGRHALEQLTGMKGIREYRGSILTCSLTSNPRAYKVVPTIHPAAFFNRFHDEQAMFSWKQKAHSQLDFFKAVRESQFPDFSSIPKRQISIIRSSLQLQQFFNMYKDYDKVYVDTEIYKSILVCIGFAFTPDHGCSIPLLDLQTDKNYKGIPMHELSEIWRMVAERLADPKLKISGQNFKADKVYWLEPTGFEVNNYYDDGMLKMHTVSPELPKSLAFQASILTNEPYYKKEGKEYNPKKDKIEVLLKYNARDCMVNCECDQALDEELEEYGLTDFFYNFVMPLYPIYEEMEKRGFLIDQEKRKELHDRYTELLQEESAKRVDLLWELGIEVEKDINCESYKQVRELVFQKLRCPQRKNTSSEVLTALANNNLKKSPKKKEVVLSIPRSRSIRKMRSVYTDFELDPDGRARYTYNQVGTETGRTSTGIIEKPLRTGKWGLAIQTTPRPDEFGGEIRKMFIPDPGKILVEFDQSQAEARIVALLANDQKLLELFDLVDVHKLTASLCFGYTERTDLVQAAHNGEHFEFLDQVTKDQRQIGKATRHGLAYDLGAEGLSKRMEISRYRASICFDRVHDMSPNIKGIFHAGIQEALATHNKVFFTPFGRRREFYNRWGRELFREAYAHIPQSTVGDITKRCLLDIRREGIDWIESLAEMHDGFVAQIPENKVEECYHLVKPIFEKPVDFERCTIQRGPITIPIDMKYGYSWGDLQEWKN